jgi:hypothetical protein
LSGIPVEDLRKRKKESKLALRAMREIERERGGGSFLWWSVGAAAFIILIMLLLKILFYKEITCQLYVIGSDLFHGIPLGSNVPDG